MVLERDPEPDVRSLAMELFAGPPHQWIVTLRSGAEIELAADLYNEEDGYATFHVGVSATPDEQAAVRVTGRAPVGPRILMMVAKIPMSEVDGVVGGWPWPQVQQEGTAADPTKQDRSENGDQP